MNWCRLIVCVCAIWPESKTFRTIHSPPNDETQLSSLRARQFAYCPRVHR